jgi:putative transposase
VDTLGLLVTAAVTKASAADCEVAPLLLARARRRGRRLALAWADSRYYGGYLDWARTELGITVQVVEPRLGRGHGFQVLPRRWVVERTNAWISRRRRCARDYERLPAHHAAMIYWAAILHLTRRLATTTTTA